MASQPITPDEQQPAAPQSFLEAVATRHGDFSDLLDEQELVTIGADVVRDYDLDVSGRADWEKIVTKAMEDAAQGERELEEGLPAYRQSHVNFPILTVAAQQFNARAYPAVCKSGAMVRVRVIGSDKGRPQLGDDGKPMMQPDPAAPAPAAPLPGPTQPGMNGTPPIGHNGGLPMVPVWQIEPGAKAKRADRVSDYLNIYVEYRMDDWEEDTDVMLYQMAIVGCGFRKLWWKNGRQCAAYVPALDLVVPITAKSLKTTPRITERLKDVYPYQIRQRQASGEYRKVELPQIGEDEEAPRLLLEQHRLMDLDKDGLDEPYIVTVDRVTSSVLKIEANFSPDDVKVDQTGKPTEIVRGKFYIKYPFLPNPKGHFYDIGFGHLLNQLGDVIDTTINQMFDAGHAQIAGGGFLASGVRLQGNGQSNTLRWQPGEYKTANVTGAALRDGIYERVFPGASPIMFQLLELILGAAKDITSVKDIITGEGSNNGQVGTTLALIEQGLTVFTAIYKRVYRSLGEEFSLIYDNLGKYGGEEAAADYDSVMDDPNADFAKDFAERDMDVKPFADPSSVTKMQRVAKAQALLGFRGQGLNDLEIDRTALEALDVEDIDKYFPDPNAPPPPAAVAELQKTQSETAKNVAQADYYRAQIAAKGAETGHLLGESEGGGADAGIAGGLPDMAGSSGDPMGLPGPPIDSGGAEGGMGGGVVGSPPVQPGAALGA
jgi:chaperonin GroES